MRIYAITEKGNHIDNEDSLLINDEIIKDGFYEREAENFLACVADGVGGNNAGAVASEFVCSELSKTGGITKENVKNINSELIKMSRLNKELENMATTLSAVSLMDDQVNLVHIGNTRINVFQGNYLKQVTEDHTTVNWLVKTGKISIKDAEFYDRRNEIVACMGGGNESLADMLVFEENPKALQNAKRIIITSDGIHEYISIDELEEVLNQPECDYKVACEQILQKVVKNGSEDDKSIMIIIK